MFLFSSWSFGQRSQMTLEKKVSLEKWNKLISAHLMLVLIVLWVWLFSTDLSQRGHARLDSMVLLLMKLDQLDQEIENALSATSSMDSTATFHRRHHPVPAQLSYLAGCDSSFFYIWNCAAVRRSQWTILFVFLLVQEFDLGSSSATSQPPTHPHAAVVAAAAALSSGSPQALGAKPKSGVSQHPNVYRNQNNVPDSNWLITFSGKMSLTWLKHVGS